ncbi:MAG: 30S ribosomal protein S4 [Candidatus Colwellbacteria bacterium]|nr:30S ribosomal protein S4 [Candidatus Colwellbacteria bacterium]
MPRVLEKKERSLGTKLSIRGERCDSPKCALIRKPYHPGQHGKRYRRNLSDFGVQLQEKQKMRLSYGLGDRELFSLLKRAGKSPTSLLEMLEGRLDNVVFRLGFAPSRSVSRQLVSHGHFLVNGKRVSTPSYQVRSGDAVSVRANSQANPYFQGLVEKLKKHETPAWLTLDPEAMEGKILGRPSEVDLPLDVNLVVDFYSK